jgi:uncharacterized protein (TIGR02453 family)
MPAPRFTKETLSFLQRLKRNNRRDWFNARKDQYEAHVKAPMLAVLEQLAVDMRAIAPEMLVGPKSMYRIYRDVRFSDNKQPYKTNIAASFWPRGLAKGEGAGMYFHIALDGVWIGGGMYRPESPQLHKVRERIAGNVQRFRSIVEAPSFKKALDGGLDGEQLTRVPRGFLKDHEAEAYLRYKQFLAGREFPVSFATSPKFYPGLLDVYRRIAPLVRFLNESLQ